MNDITLISFSSDEFLSIQIFSNLIFYVWAYRDESKKIRPANNTAKIVIAVIISTDATPVRVQNLFSFLTMILYKQRICEGNTY